MGGSPRVRKKTGLCLNAKRKKRKGKCTWKMARLAKSSRPPTIPSDAITAHQEDTKETNTPNNNTKPQKDTIAPQEDKIMLQDDTLTPEDDYTAPQDDEGSIHDSVADHSLTDNESDWMERIPASAQKLMAKGLPFCHRVSKLFQPTCLVPKGAEVKNNLLLSKSLKLMMDRGIIAHSQTGFYYLLPLGTKALDKLTRLVEENLTNIGAQKMICPTLTSTELWKKTDRLAAMGPEIIQVKDRHKKNFILSPTHEESVAALAAAVPMMSYRQLPLLMYQTTAKFRDEMKPRFGLIRAREFIMNDLYSFDTCEETAQDTYQLVTQTYEHILDSIGVKYIKVAGVSGVMGGEQSHEFHYPADIGDDTLALCGGCSHAWNTEGGGDTCPQCGGHSVTHTKGIEVGHTFLLGTKYSTALKAEFATGDQGGCSAPLVMGSYGLGLSRLLAAALEVLSVDDQLRWPPALVPYSLCIIPPKHGSKESKTTERLAEEIYWILQAVPQFKDNVIIDDRSQLSIGRRLEDARQTGYPHALVIGKAAAQPDPRVELIDIYSGESSLHPPSDIIPVIVDSYVKARSSVTQ